MPKRKGTVRSLHVEKMTTQTAKVQLTEQGLNEDDIRRRNEEETLVVSTIRTLLIKNGGKTLVSQREIADLMLEIFGINSERLTTKQ